MKKQIFSIILITILPFSFIKGQNKYFKDISYFNTEALIEKPALIYFHFKGCPPCKKMDMEVLAKPEVQVFLDSNFVSYEVYGFDSLATEFRNKWLVKGNPAFLFISKNGEEVHRIVGFYNLNDFIKECRKAFSSYNLRTLDSLYGEGNFGLNFFREYVHAKDRASQLDSNMIFEYLNRIPDSKLLNREFFEDILYFGYYEGRWDVPVGSRYFETLDRAFRKELYGDLQEYIRTRWILSINTKLFLIEDRYSILADSLLEQLKLLETGEPILLKEMYSDKYVAYLKFRYPSFEFEYNRVKGTLYDSMLSKVFNDHVIRIQDDASALNSLAWGIYEGKYLESNVTGIELVKKAISIKPAYSYFDTYAALLYKNRNFEEAKLIANKAIEIAKEQGKDYTVTENLLVEIESAILNKASTK